MNPDRQTTAKRGFRLNKLFTVEAALTILALVYIAAFHANANEDRLLLNLYYIGLVAAAYALVKRHAIAMAVLVVAVAGGTTLAQVYFATEVGSSDPLLDPIRDLLAWSVLLFLGWRLGVEAYQFQSQERRMQIQHAIEEKALATRAAALTSTSHEVRTPLTAILAVNETLLEESAGPLNDLQREFLHDIDDCAKHLMNLINDILDYAKAEAGMITLSPETVALPELIEQCVAMIASSAKKNNISVVAQIDSNVKEIVADPLRLKQILLNLLSNAVKFNQPEGLVKLQVRGDEKETTISVRDTGPGISQDEMDHLFDPYYQATHCKKGIGTGLGLSITKHLIELHEGQLEVESVTGVGSMFAVRLPLRFTPRPKLEGVPHWVEMLEDQTATPGIPQEPQKVLV